MQTIRPRSCVIDRLPKQSIQSFYNSHFDTRAHLVRILMGVTCTFPDPGQTRIGVMATGSDDCQLGPLVYKIHRVYAQLQIFSVIL